MIDTCYIFKKKIKSDFFTLLINQWIHGEREGSQENANVWLQPNTLKKTAHCLYYFF